MYTAHGRDPDPQQSPRSAPQVGLARESAPPSAPRRALPASARPRPSGVRGVALLMVISAITILALVLMDFSQNTQTHMNAGVNLRDEVRANVMADTALVLTRACLDDKAWGPLAALRSKVDLNKLCNLLLGVFIRGRIDLPIGGASVELEGVQGIGLSKGDIEEIELLSEESYIGLAGLVCASRADINCATRRTVMRQLRSLLCDPSISWWFETERPDGKRYTRAELVGNLIDWVDPDDNRIKIDEASWEVMEGAGEGEDSYYRDHGYPSKDAPFDSIEELRMVRGVDDVMFAYLKDKISVHAESKVNPNTASAEIFAALLRANSPFFDNLEVSSCGEESTGKDSMQHVVEAYSRMIVDARNMQMMLKLMSGNFLSRPFTNAQQFLQVAQNPAQLVMTNPLMGGALGGADSLAGMAALQSYLLSKDINPLAYEALRGPGGVNWQALSQGLSFTEDLFRLRVKGRVGNMTRSMYAVLRRDGPVVRTLYYREE